MKLKILHITKKYPKALGGDAVVVSNLEKQQKRRRHHVAILTSNCDEIVDGKHIYTFGLKDTPAALDNITFRRLLSLAHLFFKSFGVIRKEQPDIIHTHSIDMAAAISLAACLYKVPVVHTFHIVTFHDERQSAFRRKLELVLHKIARPRVTTAPDEADVHHLSNAGVRAKLLPNGIDLTFWHKKRAKRQPIFTFIAAGRLEDQKGFAYLVKAAILLKQQTTVPFQILVAGNGSLQTELGIMALQGGVASNISFVGRKSPKELRDMYATSDAVVIPSLWESTPLTLLEAWAMKLPVISTPVGILQGAKHQRDAAIIPLQDEKTLAVAMEELLDSRSKRTRLAKRGYVAVQHYKWKSIYETAADIYNDALVHGISTTDSAAVPIPSDPPSASTVHADRFNLCTLMVALSGLTIASLIAAPHIPGVINAFLTLPLAILIPGLLLKRGGFAAHGGASFAATAALSTALGLFTIMVESLALNWVLPLFGINDPLSTRYVVPLHLIVTGLLLGMYLKRQGTADTLIAPRVHVNRRQTLRFVVPLLVPLLAAAGAFRQNNGGGNELAVIALVIMIGLAVWFVIKPRVFNPVWLLFTISLGLLLSTSLRSWFVSGFDISQEFQVFSLTLQQHHWDLGAIPGNAYNACLSLTTLPAALQQMVGITPEYIFKFFYQIVFALTAVVIYLLGRRFADTRGAFLVGLFYVGQAQFVGTMPAIVRQQLGILFFALIIYLLISKGPRGRCRIALFGLLSAGMVLSHYSTTYIAIFILLVTGVILWLLRIKVVKRRMPEFKPALSAVTVSVLAVTLMGMSYGWYSVVNSSSSNLSSTVSASWRTLTSLDFMNGYDMDPNGAKTRLLLGGNRETAQAEDVVTYKNALDIQTPIKYAEAETLPAKNETAVWAADRIRDVLALVVKILLPLSPLLLLIFKKTRTQVADISFLGIGALVTFVAFIFLPVLSQSYNLERVFQQSLILLSLTGLWALWFILPARKKINTIVTTAFVLVFFAFSPGTGLVNQLIGGTAPRLNMNSLGEEYDKYYVHDSEVKAAAWLGKHCAGQAIWADRYATLRVTAYGGVPYDDIRSDILDADKGCLMLDRTNTAKNLYYASYKKQPVRYTAPDTAFDQYDLLYSNGESRVYQY